MPAELIPDISVVVPAYNEAARLGPTVDALLGFFEGRGTRFEIVLVNEGSRDSTLELMESLTARSPAIKVVSLPVNRGKGRATAAGVCATRGRVVLTTDADLSTPIEEIDNFIAALGSGAVIAIASRALKGAVIVVSQPFYRVFMGRAFNRLVQWLVLPGLHDTQCGFKLYQGDIARRLFAHMRVDGFAFDVEILIEARRHGHRIVEIPVRWLNSEDSRVSPGRHSLEMLRDILKLRLGLVGSADSPQPAAVMVDRVA